MFLYFNKITLVFNLFINVFIYYLDMNKIIFLVFCFLFSSVVLAEGYNIYTPDNYKYSKSDNTKTLFILDFSNSMNEYISDEKKVDTMKSNFKKILKNISQESEIGMRIYGYRLGFTPYDACKASKLSVPIIKGGSNIISKELESIRAIGMTPITYSLKQAINHDFKNFNGHKHIILLTDGGENCDESPCIYIMRTIKNEPKLKIDVIAYDIRNSDDISQLECVALVTRGQFYTANTSIELFNSLNNASNAVKEVEAEIIP